MKNRFRIICAFLALCVICAFALAAFGHSHDCCGDGCAICLALRAAVALFESTAAAAISALVLISVTRAVRRMRLCRERKTPVALFVKLLD